MSMILRLCGCTDWLESSLFVPAHIYMPPDKSGYWKIIFYFSTKTYVVGTQKNRLNETVLLNTQNTCKEINAILGAQPILIWTYAYIRYTQNQKQRNHFIIYKVMKYRKIFVKYNAYFKKAVFHSRENTKKMYFHCSENISCISRVKLDVLCFHHWLPWAHFRISNACNFLELGICSTSAILESYNCFRNFYTLKK